MQLVGALRDNPEGRKCDSRWSHWDFLSIQSFRPHYVHGLTEVSTRNFSWRGLWRPVRRADNLTNLMCRLSGNMGASTSWNPQGLWGLYRDCFTLYKIFGSQQFPRLERSTNWLQTRIRNLDDGRSLAISCSSATQTDKRRQLVILILKNKIK
jgi:hypothetical protein